MDKKAYRSGFVALIGRPNVGKSTLMNRILGQKVAIMSDKAQTTRNRIQGIYTDEEAQIIFVDTPGIHKPKHALGQFMMDTAKHSLSGVDCICVLVNSAEKMGPGDRRAIETALATDLPVFLLINKLDLVDKEALLGVIAAFSQDYDFHQVIPISALEGIQLDVLMDEIKQILPLGPQYYPADQVSDHPEYFAVSEFIREKVLHLTREEVPHSIAVQVERMRRNPEGFMEVDAVIFVERASQKGIIIGSGGKMIKRIRQQAQRDIQDLLGEPVDLEVWVKVNKNWRDRASQLHQLGYQPEEY